MAQPKKMKLKFELIRLNPEVEKKLWWGFGGNFGPGRLKISD